MADISSGDFGDWLKRKAAEPASVHHDPALRTEAFQHLEKGLGAHFGDNPAATIPEAQLNNVVNDYVETHHGVKRGTLAPQGESYIRDRVNNPSHAGNEAFLAERRNMVSQVGGPQAARVEAQLRSRDQAMRAAGQHAELDELHRVEQSVFDNRAKSFKNLTTAEQADHLHYAQRPDAIPQLQEAARKGNSGGRSDPGFGSRGTARKRATTPVAGTDAFLHHDDTVTRVHNGQVQVVQEGWDHANVRKQAQSNLQAHGSAYHSPAEVKAGRKAAPTPLGGDKIGFHDGTVMSVGADGTHKIETRGWDAAHAQNRIGAQNMEGYTAPPAPAAKLGRAERKVAARATMIESSLASAPNQTHINTARDHVNSTINWMETSPDATRHHKQALKRLKAGHIDEIVHDYAHKLGTDAHPKVPDLGHLTEQMVEKTHTAKWFPTVMKGRNAVDAAGAGIAAAARGAPGVAAAALQADLGAMASHGLGATGRGIASGAVAVKNGVVTAAPVVASGISTVGGAIGHGAVEAGKKSLGFAKGAGKAVLITGAVGAGLFAATQLLKSPRPPRRMDDFIGGDMGSEPIVFNGGANVGMGTLSVPQVGQQAQMGNWVQQVPAMDQSQGMPTVPTR